MVKRTRPGSGIRPSLLLPVLGCGLFVLTSLPARGGDATITLPGTPAPPQATFNHATLEWPIQGDSDLDGQVTVRFRVQGAADWRAALPLRRVPAGSNAGFAWGNRHSGSLFGLAPGTAYEVELSLIDPDGGDASVALDFSTRTPPAPAAGGRLRNATPATLATLLGDALPGDIITLGGGTYAGFQLARDGSPGAPIVLRGSAGAVVEGEIGLFFRSHILLQDLTVRGRIRFNGSQDIGISGCDITATLERNGDGIVSFLRAERAWIADNTLTGLTAWSEAALGADGDNLGEGIVVNGPGHVIERNHVRGFRDGISFMEDAEAQDQFGIDVLHNHIEIAADDAIEADFCAHNCRIVGNRVSDAFIAFSSQPSLGGPTYFVRNVAYNVVHVPFKLYRGSRGDVLLHNTVVKHGDGFNAYPGQPIAGLYARNNLFLGGAFGDFNGYSSGSGRVVDLATLVGADSSLDYNGYGTTLPSFNGRIGAVSFSGLAQLRALTSERHAQQVDYDVFATPVAFPVDPLSLHSMPSMDLAPDSVAVDAGETLPTINDDYSGAAPDLGAFESDAAVDPDAVFADGFEAS